MRDRQKRKGRESSKTNWTLKRFRAFFHRKKKKQKKKERQKKKTHNVIPQMLPPRGYSKRTLEQFQIEPNFLIFFLFPLNFPFIIVKNFTLHSETMKVSIEFLQDINV